MIVARHEESLDLAWCIDFSDQDLKSQDDPVLQSSADLGAAWRMLDWLRRRFDFRVLNDRSPDREDSESESTAVEQWIKRAVKRGTSVTPRFFDNRETSLLSQLPALVRKHGSQSARNYVAMGSGFYESADNNNGIPSILKRIVDKLHETELLTRQPDIEVFVNPQACQAVANSVPWFNHAGWKVWEAGQPEYFKAPRSLHAKFIFSANYRENSDLCNSAWLYLGSGNLTGPGFANRMASGIGNLEAGVLFTPQSLRWKAAKGIPPESVLTNLLPLGWETDLSLNPEGLAAGNDMPEPETQYSAAPVAYFLWIVEEDIGWLRTDQEISEPFDLVDAADTFCQRNPVKGFPVGRNEASTGTATLECRLARKTGMGTCDR